MLHAFPSVTHASLMLHAVLDRLMLHRVLVLCYVHKVTYSYVTQLTITIILVKLHRRRSSNVTQDPGGLKLRDRYTITIIKSGHVMLHTHTQLLRHNVILHTGVILWGD